MQCPLSIIQFSEADLLSVYATIDLCCRCADVRVNITVARLFFNRQLFMTEETNGGFPSHYTLSHVSPTTINFNRSNLGIVSPYVTCLLLTALLVCAFK